MKRVLLAVSLAICLTATSFAQQFPRPAGAWSAQTVDHKVLKLDQFKGKFVVLAFLLTTCPHCQKFTGVLSQIQQEYASKGVQVVGATIDQTGTVALADFVQRFSPGFPIGAMENSQLYTFGQYGMQQHTYMPMVFFIDRAGMVQAQFMGSDSFFAEGDPATNLRSTLNRLMTAGTTSSAKKAPSAAAKK
jgi:thiol-disulfide isomerase/thioredoxin